MRLYIGNLPFQCNEEQLAGLLAGCRSLRALELVHDQRTGTSRGFAFAEFGDDTEAQAAIAALHGCEFAGRQLTVRPARPAREFGPNPGRPE